MADFRLVFAKKVTVEQALAPLKKETEDGKLGKLKVDPDSLKAKIRRQGDHDVELHLHGFFLCRKYISLFLRSKSKCKAITFKNKYGAD